MFFFVVFVVCLSVGCVFFSLQGRGVTTLYTAIVTVARSLILTRTLTTTAPRTQADGVTSTSTSTTTAAAAGASGGDGMDVGGEEGGDKKAGVGGQGQGGQGAPVTVEEVYRRVEEMARLH